MKTHIISWSQILLEMQALKRWWSHPENDVWLEYLQKKEKKNNPV